MSVPNPAAVDWVPIWQTGLVVPQTQPYARAYRSTSQSIPNVTYTSIVFDGVRADRGSTPHWSAANPTRLTCQVAGVYAIACSIQFAGALAGGDKRMAVILVNGGFLSFGGEMSLPWNAGGGPFASSATLHYLNVGDYIELQAYQDSGSAQMVASQTLYSPELMMALVGGMQGPAGVGVPTPVVNGQFIKGVGGQAVWASQTAYGTSLPASPLDGDEAILVDSLTNPVYQWHFRYNAGSSSAYKWEFIGGTDWVNYVAATSESIGAAWTVVGAPQAVVPRLGVYLLSASVRAAQTTTGNTVHLAVGGTNDTPGGESSFSVAAGGVMALAPPAMLHTFTTTADRACFWAHGGSGGATFSGRGLYLRPVRVA